MKTKWLNRAALWLAALTLAAAPDAPAQETNTNAVAVASQIILEAGDGAVKLGTPAKGRESRHGQGGEPVVRIGQDYTLASGETIEELVVISGKVQIEGTVDGDMVVLLGRAELGSNAVVKGNLVVVGGVATVASNTVVKGELVIVGGALEAAEGFKPGGEQVVIGISGIGEKFDWLLPWLKRGLLWGRPIVPELPWVWLVAGILLFVHFLLNLLFDKPVRACTATLVEKPFTTFLVGMLVLVLFGPVCLLLVASVAGIIVVPFLSFALLLAAVLGKIAVARWLGG